MAKRPRIVIALVLAVAGASAAVSFYKRARTGDDAVASGTLNGRWETMGAGGRVDIQPDGAWEWHSRGTAVRGVWQGSGKSIQVSDRSIEGPGAICSPAEQGRYLIEWKQPECEIILHATEEPCRARLRALNGTHLIRPRCRSPVFAGS